jgi:hypothetical protein
MDNSTQSDNDVQTFAKRLPLMVMNNISFQFYEMLPLCGIGPAIAFSRCLSLHRKIVTATHSLVSAYRLNHTDLWGKTIDDATFERSMYFEQAIEAYNKVIDYIYQIIYFNYELYGIVDEILIQSREDIIFASEKIKGNKLNKIDKWICNDKRTIAFSTIFLEYKDYVESMRNLANDIKHRGCISVSGVAIQRRTKVTKNINGVEIDITDLVSEKVLDLDVEIEKLVEVHQQTFELQKAIFTLCDFHTQLKDFLKKNI